MSVDYVKYLQSPEWAVVRRLALEQAGHACRLCGAPEDESRLQVHHRTYERLGAELLADVIVLCGPCHLRHHDSLQQPPEIDDLEFYAAALQHKIEYLDDRGGEVPAALIADRDFAFAVFQSRAGRG